MSIPPSSCMSRRVFLSLALGAAAGTLSGCAVNPVTGQSQLMLMSRDQEIHIDRERSPHQFSADYGVLQDEKLNAYIGQTGKRLAGLTHRPDMPYSFQGVNAAYVNAYAFPGGSIAVTRGILVEMEDEAELAALLGHEPGLHKIQGIGDGFVPDILDPDEIDRVMTVTDEEAIETTRKLARKEGALCGTSSGANVWAAIQLAEELGPDKTIVTVLPDRAERYFSTALI